MACQRRQDILDYGVSCEVHPVIGARVDEMVEQGYPFGKAAGLEFCKLCTIDDERVRTVLESLFEWSGLGFYRVFGYDQDRTFSFLNYTGPAVKALFVQLWSSKSRAVFYGGSHLHSLHPRQSGNGIFEIAEESLAVDSITPIEVEMKEGGLAMVDARLGFKILQGYVINLGFATKGELQEWATMKLEYSDSLRRKVVTMTSEKIGMNFELVKPSLTLVGQKQ